MAPTCRDFCLLLLPFALLHVLLRPSPASSPLMPGAACAHESRWFEDVLFSLWALASGSGDNHAQNTLLYALIDALAMTNISAGNSATLSSACRSSITPQLAVPRSTLPRVDVAND